MTGNVTWDLVLFLFAFGAGVLIVWWRIEGRVERAEKVAEADLKAADIVAGRLSDQIAAVEKALADYKLEAAQTYASFTMLKEVEVRLTTAIDRLADRMEQLPTRFAEQMSQFLPSRTTRK